ncbi:MAG: hypothetical protein JXD23_15750 [Spirochaetales bacterium]|nr:hypothetical protein [Spirochaetales bacterium]
MKRFLALFVCLACAGTLAAENAALTITNGEANWLYYSVDPAFTTPGAEAAGAADFFSVLDKARFGALPPGGSQRVQGLSAGAHALVGFWVTDKTAFYGVFRLSVSLAPGQNKAITLKKTAALASRETATGPVPVKETLPDSPIVIDGAFADWEPYPAVAVFPPTSAPEQFTVQDKDGARNLPIRNSASWGRAGTQLLTVKALWRAEALYLYASSSCPIDPGLSIFLYLFDDRKSAEPNRYTMEIPIVDASGEGKVLLWQRGVKESTAIGTFRTNGPALEASIDFAALPDALRIAFFDRYSIDLKTDYHDAARGLYEEFYFTTLVCNEIYRQQ